VLGLLFFSAADVLILMLITGAVVAITMVRARMKR
jgi:hypothetical protein